MRQVWLGPVLLGAYALIACSAPAPENPRSSQTQPVSSAAQPTAVINPDTAVDPVVRGLEREAIALARPDGCATADQCRSAPMGSRPCGGPRYYVPYCPLTTDTAALFAKLAEVARAEEAWNRRNMMASTCEMRMAPDLERAGGACRARVPVR